MQKLKPINKHFYNTLKCFLTTDNHYKYDKPRRLLYVYPHVPCVISYEFYERLLKLRNEKTTLR